MTPIEQVINTISAEQADRLYWLGRYVERVFSTLRLFNRSLDRMIDQNGDDYVDFLPPAVDSLGDLRRFRGLPDALPL